MRRITSILFTGILAMSLLSCSADKELPTDPGGPAGPSFSNLTEREHVLTNLELAYNTRNLGEYQKLIDDDFVFFFGQADIDNGRVGSPQWARSSEMSSATNLFNPAFDPPGDAEPVSQIVLNMTWPAGENTWTEVTAPGGQEMHYEKTVQYTLSVVAGQTTYTNAQALTASFVVRFDSNAGRYRIVQWRDDI